MPCRPLLAGGALLVALALAGCTTEDGGPAGAPPSAAASTTPPPTTPAERAPTTPAERAPAPPSRGPAADAGTGTEAAETFTMPAVVGMNLQTAQDELQSLGSFLMDQQDAGGLRRHQLVDSNWKVCRQDPAPGAVVPIATVVTLGAVKLDERCP